MKTKSVVSASFFCLAILASHRSQTTEARATPNAEQEVRAIETLKLQYPLEPTRWAARVDDNAVFTQGSGKVITKAELLDAYHAPAASYKNSLHMIDPEFKLFGDTAVLSYIYTRARQDGRDTIRQHIRRTAIYQRQASKWQLIASTSIAFPNLDRQQKPVDPKILDSYVGLYEGKSEDRPRGDSFDGPVS
jgi:hypothetical protein